MGAFAPELEDHMLRSMGRMGAFSRRGWMMGAAVALGLAFAAPAGAQQGKVLKWGAAREIASLDPYSFGDTFTLATLNHVYEGLVRYTGELGIEPALAESWETVSPTVWRFKLRSGVNFHNGEAFTADDVVASLERVTHESSPLKGNLPAYKARFVYKCTEAITVNDIMMSPARMAMMGIQYALFRTGPLTASAGQVGIFTKSRPDLDAPDIQFHFIGFSADRPGEGLHKFSGFSQNICQLRPESRGELLLKSPDPMAPPAIHPHYLSAETDRRVLVDGLQLARRIAAQAPIRAFIASEYLPGEQVQTDDEMLEYARTYGGTIFHPIGTAKMGQDPTAVVDAELKVHGIAGLRVADAAIMPTMVSGNTNAACIMIGEKCADLVKGKQLARAA